MYSDEKPYTHVFRDKIKELALSFGIQQPVIQFMSFFYEAIMTKHAVNICFMKIFHGTPQ